jgi:predicted ATPase
MRLFALAGQPADARRQYEDVTRRLRDELGLAPSAETRELLAAILAGQIGPRGIGRPADLSSAPQAPCMPSPPSSRRPEPPADAGLPGYLTPLIGRERELGELTDLLARPDVRLVSLLGPGGVGKTRLAVEAARSLHGQFRDGARFVPLAPINDPTTLALAIAQAVGVRLAGAGAPAAELENALRERSLLLVLDNFEQLLQAETPATADAPDHLSAASLVARLLAVAPGVKALVTSRAPLRLYGEWQYPLMPLALPADARAPASLAALLEVPAVRLFVERAQATLPSFNVSSENADAVAAVCRRLDGLPLAIELAAARARVLSPTALLARLERALPLLTGGPREVPERQQTLRNTIAWSCGLLEPAEQAFFRRLAVFAGGFYLAAAEAVAAVTEPGAPGQAPAAGLRPLDLMTALVDKSLVIVQGGEPELRFRLLETIREFALEQLEASGEEPALRRRHAGYYLGLIKSMGWVPRGPDTAPWLDRLEAERDNVRAALGWALAAGEVELAGRLAGSMEPLWEMRGYGAEGLRWFEAVLQAGGDLLSVETHGWVLWGAIRMALHRHDLERTARYTHTLLALREQLSRTDDLFTLLHSEASLARQQGDYARAWALFEQLLDVQRANYQDEIAWGLHDLAEVAQLMGDTARAEAMYTQSLASFRAGQEWVGVAWSLHNQAYLAQQRGEYAQAQAMWEESFDLFRRLGARDGMASALAGLAAAAHIAGDDLAAARLFGQADAVLDEAGMQLATVARAEDARFRAATREALGGSAFDAAYLAGRNAG